MYEIINVENVEPEMYITITDGIHKIVAFSADGKYDISDNNVLELKAFNSTNIMASFVNECSVKLLNATTYLQHVVGILEDRNDKIVKVDDITIKLSDYIPNDINNGQYIEFDVVRLEIW